mgnify:FL=1
MSQAVSATATKARRPRPHWLAPAVIWVVGSLWILTILQWMRIFRRDQLEQGVILRLGDSADSAWQTIRLWEMWTLGPQVLWQMHIYPPLYDGIRFLLMLPDTLPGAPPTALAVDKRLYWLSAVLFGLVAMVIYLWIRDLTDNGWWALSGSLLWMLLPSSISFMTILNQTGLAIASMAVAFYFLYRFLRTRRNIYAAVFLGSLLIASLTRNVVQVHVFLILCVAVVAFYWIGRPRSWRYLVVYGLLLAAIAFWPIRALALYSTFDVSTHTGYNRAGALWIHPRAVPEPAWPENIEQNATLLSSGWNTQETLRDNYRLGSAANEFMVTQPLEAAQRMFDSAQITWPVMFRSVFIQWENQFLMEYPLARSLDSLFSGASFQLLIATTVLILLARVVSQGNYRIFIRYGWFAVFWTLTAIPVLLSNRHWPVEEMVPIHSEADRLRALIDIPVFVLMFFAAFTAAQWIGASLRKYRSPEVKS